MNIVTDFYRRLAGEPYDLTLILIELALIGLCVNWCAGVLKGTRGTRPLRGVLIILVATTLAVRVLTIQFEWVRLDLLYRYILYAMAFIALVVFQPELRRAVIRVGDVRWRRRGAPRAHVVTSLVKSAGYLSRNKYGAVIAIQRGVDLAGWAENGTLIRAEVSANLLNTIFFPNSPLHDLGVIIRDTKVLAANCQFPQVESDEVDAALGSRHLAALGMSYETDALVLVVSEETGVISLADNGKLTRYLSLDDLADELNNRLAAPHGAAAAGQGTSSFVSSLKRGLRRLAVVVPLTLIIWWVADQATYVTERVRVQLDFRAPDPAWEVTAGQERLVFEATLNGPARTVRRARDAAAERPLRITYGLSRTFTPRAEPYVFEGRDVVREIVENAREIQELGVTVLSVGLSRVSLDVHKRVTLTMPVGVRAEAGALRIAAEWVDPPEVEVEVRESDRERLEAQGAVFAVLGEQLEGLQPGDVRTLTAALRQPVGLSGPAVVAPAEVHLRVRVVARPRSVKDLIVGLYVAPEVAAVYDVQKNDLNEWRINVEVQGEEVVADAGVGGEVAAVVLVSAAYLPAEGQPLETQVRTLEIQFLTPKGLSVVGRRTVQVTLVPRSGASP